MIAFVIWSIVAVVFLIIGISAWFSKKEVGFFQGVQPPKMKDVKAYNHAVAKIWFVFAVLFEIIGLPLIRIEQNSPIALLSVLLVVFLVIGIAVAYMRVEKKYRQ